MRRHALGLVLAMLLLAATLDASAQSPYRDTPTNPTTLEHLRQPVLDEDGGGFSGLLDMSRVNMNHSLGFGYSSGGGRGISQGYYMNTLSYQFDAPVLLRVRTGVTNNPFASSGSYSQPGQSSLTGLLNNAEFFGGADLFWKPTENSLLRISVDRLAPGMYGYNRFGNGFGNRYGFGMPGYYDHYSPFGFADPWGPYNN